MARQMKQVDSTEVRSWANETGWRDELDRPVADRGRMPSGLIDAYNRANKRNFKEYVSTPRPIRSDYREQAEAERAERAARPARSASTAITRNSGGSRAAKAATATRESESVPVGTDETGIQSLQDVIAMLTAAENKKGGRQAVVTIQTLVTV